MVTIIYMERRKLITKKSMENYYNRKKFYYKHRSVNDDLEYLFNDIQLGFETTGDCFTYFLPQLTNEQLELVAEKDIDFLNTFLNSNPDVEKAEMEASESDSKFVLVIGYRSTFKIENSLKRKNSS